MPTNLPGYGYRAAPSSSRPWGRRPRGPRLSPAPSRIPPPMLNRIAGSSRVEERWWHVTGRQPVDMRAVAGIAPGSRASHGPARDRASRQVPRSGHTSWSGGDRAHTAARSPGVGSGWLAHIKTSRKSVTAAATRFRSSPTSPLLNVSTARRTSSACSSSYQATISSASGTCSGENIERASRSVSAEMPTLLSIEDPRSHDLATSLPSGKPCDRPFSQEAQRLREGAKRRRHDPPRALLRLRPEVTGDHARI